MKQQLKWSEDLKSADLITKNDDGSITSEPLTLQEATQWTAENKY